MSSPNQVNILGNFIVSVASAQKGPYALRVRSVAEKAFFRKSKKEENLQ